MLDGNFFDRLASLPNIQMRVGLGARCLFFAYCPFANDCKGAYKDINRNDPFICDIEKLKEIYENGKPVKESKSR